MKKSLLNYIFNYITNASHNLNRNLNFNGVINPMKIKITSKIKNYPGRLSYLNNFSCFAVISILSILISSNVYPQTGTIQTNVPALKTVYDHDFYIGCLLSYAHVGFSTDPVVPGQSSVVDPNGGYLIKFHMNSMSPGNWMKSVYIVDIAGSASAYNAATTQAEKDSIDVHPIIKFNGNIIAQLNWAQRQGFTFRGHTLVWHNQTPGTAFFRSGYTTTGARLTKDQMTLRLENYIEEVIRIIHASWPGLLSAYDVVNEAIDDNTGAVRTTGNEWYTTFGDSTYIMDAFEFARKYTQLYGENQIKLYYNDYNTENPKKADGIVRLLTPIYQAGYLDGIGMQKHNNLTSPVSAQSFIDSYNKFYPICSEMAVTELDVATGSSTPSSAVLAKQANEYGMLFKCFVERSYKSGRGKIINVSKDGLNDAWTFQANQSSSLWDSKDQCKPAFYVAANVGINYNIIDSLLNYSDTLTSSLYTAASWQTFSNAFSFAKSAMDSNYSVNTSADTTLSLAKDSLESAINGLKNITTGIANLGLDIPKSFLLNQNYPNPFNPSTAISYQLSAFSHVTLKIFDILGNEVSTLVNENQRAGYYKINFNAGNLSSGVYFYRLQAGNFVSSKKMIVLK